MIDPDIADCLTRVGHPEMEGGDVLRGAVLDILDGPGLQESLVNEAIEEFCAELPKEEATLTREEAIRIGSWLIELESDIRDRAESYQALGLRILAWMNRENSTPSEDGIAEDFPNQEALDQLKKIINSEKRSAEIAALSRTTTGVTTDTNVREQWVQWRNFLRQMLLDAQWRKEHSKTNSIRSTFEGWETAEKLDRYYASQIVTRLEQIVERAVTLDRVQLEITDVFIKQLFQSAHETFLYGFDVACIALCRSLVEHALDNKLSPLAGENRQLGCLIERANREKVLTGPELEAARKVLRGGNDVMHSSARSRPTAQQTLDCARLVLNSLYGAHRSVGALTDGRVS